MSKLSAFLSKSKKKGAAKAADTPLAVQPGLAVASKVEQVAPVTLDVIQPKVRMIEYPGHAPSGVGAMGCGRR